MFEYYYTWKNYWIICEYNSRESHTDPYYIWVSMGFTGKNHFSCRFSKMLAAMKKVFWKGVLTFELSTDLFQSLLLVTQSKARSPRSRKMAPRQCTWRASLTWWGVTWPERRRRLWRGSGRSAAFRHARRSRHTGSQSVTSRRTRP